MSAAAARRLVFLLLGLYVVALTWPGVTLFNRVQPLVLGLPFVLFWITGWVVLVGGALALLHVAESREEAHATPATPAISGTAVSGEEA